MRDNNVRTLIVDQQEAECASLATQICRKGDTAIIATSAQQARAWLATDSFDLVLLGVDLADKDGLKLCAEARERLGDDTIIIVLAAKSTPLGRVTGMQLGADDVIGKPWNIEEVLVRIDAFRRRRQRL